MYKNFSAPLLGISGRQSELIELALTYGFRGIDVDMTDMVKRSQRTDFEDASKYLRAADILIGGFNADVQLDADDSVFNGQLAALHPMAETAAKLNATRAFVNVPAATDRMPIHEYFEFLQTRLEQMGRILDGQGIRLGVAMNASSDSAEGKQFEAIRKAESLIALVKGVPSKNVGIVLDSWHWTVGGGTLDHLRSADPTRIAIVRLADIAADVDLSAAKPSDRIVPSTEGSIDQVGIVKWLSDVGYDGPVLPCSSAAKAKGQTRESIVNKAQEGIDAIFTAAGLTVAPRPMDLIQAMYDDYRDDEEEVVVRRSRTDDDIEDDEELEAGADDLPVRSR